MKKLIMYGLIVTLFFTPATLIIGEETQITSVEFPDCIGFKYNESTFLDVNDYQIIARYGICLEQYKDNLDQTKYTPVKMECHGGIDDGKCRKIEEYPFIALVNMNCSYSKTEDRILCENEDCKLSSNCPELDFTYENEVK